jgi:hypothetical protein
MCLEDFTSFSDLPAKMTFWKTKVSSCCIW